MAVTKEQQLIQDVLRAAYRSSSLLFDNLDIKIDREKAFRIYASKYNRTPRMMLREGFYPFLFPLPKKKYLDPEDLSDEHQKLAILQYAHDQAMTWR